MDQQLQAIATVLIAIGTAVATTWFVMLLTAGRAGRRQGAGFLRDTITRLMGLIVLSMGVQFALTGFRPFTV